VIEMIDSEKLYRQIVRQELQRVKERLNSFLPVGSTIDDLRDGDEFRRVSADYVDESGRPVSLVSAATGRVITGTALEMLGTTGTGYDGDLVVDSGTQTLTRGVWNLTNLIVSSGATLNVPPLTTLLVRGDVVIDGTLNVGLWGTRRTAPGMPGDGLGGGGSYPIAGRGFGGGGGGNGGAGGNGGVAGEDASQGGQALPPGTLMPGSCGGSGSMSKYAPAAGNYHAGACGRGGGLLVIMAGGDVVITGTINANGEAGGSAGSGAPTILVSCGGGGGWSGGTVYLVSYASISIPGTVSLKGGAGGSGIRVGSLSPLASGGGGGGGGSFYARAPKYSRDGDIFVDGGVGGTGGGGQAGGAGSPGIIIERVEEVSPFWRP